MKRPSDTPSQISDPLPKRQRSPYPPSVTQDQSNTNPQAASRPNQEGIIEERKNTHDSVATDESQNAPEGQTLTLQINTASLNVGHAFRVKGLDLQATTSDVTLILKTQFSTTEDHIRIKSLAKTVDGRSQVAIVGFTERPINLCAGSSWTLDSSSGIWPHQRRPCTLDSEFHGLTVLYCPPVDDHQVDIVAISGLGGHAYGSFKEAGGSHMWLSDSLPDDIPGARIAIYGYSSGLQDSESFQHLGDLGNSFARAIQSLQGSVSPKRPIIFIAHSLGGLIVKEAIVQLSKSRNNRASEAFRLVYGALFFGVPNDGLDITSLISFVGDGANRALIEALGQNNSHVLKILHERFNEAFNREGSTEIHCFYETRKSGTAAMDKNGRLAMIGEPKVLVNTVSATHCRPWENTNDHMTAMPRDHSSLVKFGPQDDDYEKVRIVLEDMVQRAVEHQDHSDTAFGPIGEQEKEALINSLRFDQIDARHDTIRKASAETCQWLLEKPQYHEWFDPKKRSIHNGFLWIRGKPGAGKSTIMKFTLETLRKKKEYITIHFFFNARGDELEKTTTGMYRSILFQLLERHPDLQRISHVLRPRLWNRGVRQWTLESLQEVFGQAVSSLGDIKLICLIDALDECGEDQIRKMVEFFEQLGDMTTSAGISFQVCFASRHYPHITVSKQLSLILEDERGHSEDIKKYLASKLKIQPKSLAENIRMDVQEKACGVFMWVVLVAGILQREYDRGRKHKLQERLRDIPKDLNELFRDVLTRDEDDKDDKENEKDKDNLLLCIQWVLFAKRPLKPRELHHAILTVNVDELQEVFEVDGMDDDDISRFITDSSKGLAEITKSGDPRVQFIHESVRDCLLAKDGLKQVWHNLESNFAGSSHERLKRCCLKYMMLSDSASSHGEAFPDPNRTKSTGTIPPVAQLFYFEQYAVENMLYHADAAEGNGISQSAFFETFDFGGWIRHYNGFREFDLSDDDVAQSPLYISARQDWSHLTGSFATKYSFIEEGDGIYGMPLLAAVVAGNRNSVYAMLKAEATGKPQDSPLHKLCEEYYNEKNKQIRRFDNLNFRKDERSLISHLMERGERSLVRFLLAAERPIVKIALNCVAETPLMTALMEALLEAVIGGSKDMIEILVESMAQNNDDIHYCHETLLNAAAQGHVAIIEWLLKHGVSPHLPLYLAVKFRYPAVVELLLKHGANIAAVDKHGKTSLWWAVHFEQMDITHLLLQYGARVDELVKGPLLILAARHGETAIVRTVLKIGVDIDARDAFRRTPLANAVIKRRMEIIQLLLEKGAHVDAPDRRGRTPMHYAAQWGFLEVIRVLLAHNAQINIVDKYKRTPLSLAMSQVQTKAVQLLAEYGARLP